MSKNRQTDRGFNLRGHSNPADNWGFEPIAYFMDALLRSLQIITKMTPKDIIICLRYCKVDIMAAPSVQF